MALALEIYLNLMLMKYHCNIIIQKEIKMQGFQKRDNKGNKKVKC